MAKKESVFARLFKETLTRISPELNTRVVYFMKFKKFINLRHPKTLDEKIQYLKLNDYLGNPLVTRCADKYAVRDYVRECGCSEILNELLGVYDSVDEIPWNELPEKFVIKWNFGCGQNLICFDKSKLDVEASKKKLKEWYRLHDRFYLEFSEMQYKDIKPKLICEKLIETEHGGLPVDYKFYCFGGDAECVLVCSNRMQKGQKVRFYFFDKEWNLKRYNKAGKAALPDFTIPKPDGIEKLFDYARKLSKPFPFVRADFYLENGKAYFGELTFTPCGGFDVNRLPETQIFFGDKVVLPAV